jgi:parallel beta-helix repeat protein
MAGITDGRPELAVGEPIRFGDALDFEIEHHPISDRLIIRDTNNGEVAYVRAEDTAEFGGDDVLVKALKAGKPMADDGRVYDTIALAERAAGSWVFVPPGTYNGAFDIRTDGLTLRGCGRSTVLQDKQISGSSPPGIVHMSDGVDVTLQNIAIDASTTSGDTPLDGIRASDNQHTFVDQCYFLGADRAAYYGKGDAVFVNSVFENCGIGGDGGSEAVHVHGCIIDQPNTGYSDSGTGFDDSIVSNNIIRNSDENGITISDSEGSIVTGNRVLSAGSNGIYVAGDDCVVVSNRVADSANQDIKDSGTGTLVEANVTGASN